MDIYDDPKEVPTLDEINRITRNINVNLIGRYHGNYAEI